MRFLLSPEVRNLTLSEKLTVIHEAQQMWVPLMFVFLREILRKLLHIYLNKMRDVLAICSIFIIFSSILENYT